MIFISNAFPWYLFALPETEDDYRDKCIHFARLMTGTSFILILILGAVLAVAPVRGFQYDIVACFLFLAIGLAARVRLNRSKNLDLIGMALLWSFPVVAMTVIFFRELDIGGTMWFPVIMALFWGAVFTRFALRGWQLRSKQLSEQRA